MLMSLHVMEKKYHGCLGALDEQKLPLPRVSIINVGIYQIRIALLCSIAGSVLQIHLLHH